MYFVMKENPSSEDSDGERTLLFLFLIMGKYAYQLHFLLVVVTFTENFPVVCGSLRALASTGVAYYMMVSVVAVASVQPIHWVKFSTC